MSRASISDVAKLAEVSKSTVSHVINNTRFVEATTKQRVLDAIEQLNYSPSKAAQSLTTNKTHTVGVIVSDITNHYFGELVLAIETVFNAANYSVIVCNTNEQLERERVALNLLTSQRVDAIIAAATSENWDELMETGLKGIPVVFLDRVFDEFGDDAYVGANNHAGAYMATEHLIAHGHKHIGILAGFQRLSSMRERLQGYKNAMLDHDMGLRDEWIVPSGLSVDAGYRATQHLMSLPERPTALVINNNLLSLGAITCLKDLNVSVPDDVALVGFDDHPWAAVSAPPLTIVKQPVQRLGQTAAELALQLMQGDNLKHQNIVLDCELVIRESCGGRHTKN